jgi:hypothetical protein
LVGMVVAGAHGQEYFIDSDQGGSKSLRPLIGRSLGTVLDFVTLEQSVPNPHQIILGIHGKGIVTPVIIVIHILDSAKTCLPEPECARIHSPIQRGER